MASRFGDVLRDRRRQLGLSIQQVANTIKIRPQIIEYFEMGDFTQMPLRGYAQGMISSYARFLGLNPREIVSMYFDELDAYERSHDRSGGRLQAAAGDATTRDPGRTGRFMLVDAPRSRYGSRPPQAGYVPEASSGHEPVRVSDSRGYGARGRSLPRGDSPRGAHPGSSATERVYGYRSGADAGVTADLTDARARVQARPSRPQRGAARPAGPGGDTRRTGSGRRDAGRRAPAGNGRSGGRGRADSRGRGGRDQVGTIIAGVDDRLVIGAALAVLAIIVLAAVLLFRGCTSADAPSDEGTGEATVSTITPAGSSDAGSSDDADAADADEAGSDAGSDATSGDGADGADGEANVPEQVVITISVAKGDSAWLEVKLDGKTVFGDEVIGPFEQTYTVEDTIRITTDSPGSVRVTQNDESLRWDTGTAGVARINVTAPEPAAQDAADGSDAAAGGSDAQSDDSASTGGSQTADQQDSNQG